MMKRILLALLVALLLVACGADEGEVTMDDYPTGVSNVINRFAADLGVAADSVVVTNYEEAEWSDSCFGLGGPEESCAQVIVPGWDIDAEVDGREYDIRADELGDNYRYEE